MDYERLSTDLKDLQRRNRRLGLALSGLVLAMILALGTILKIAGTERTVIVPPAIERAFWVTSERAGKAYLEQMASYVAYLVLDVDPDTIDWKRSALLDWVAPDQHATMRNRGANGAAEVEPSAFAAFVAAAEVTAQSPGEFFNQFFGGFSLAGVECLERSFQESPAGGY